jgi:hypothetical protein
MFAALPCAAALAEALTKAATSPSAQQHISMTCTAGLLFMAEGVSKHHLALISKPCA